MGAAKETKLTSAEPKTLSVQATKSRAFILQTPDPLSASETKPQCVSIESRKGGGD